MTVAVAQAAGSGVTPQGSTPNPPLSAGGGTVAPGGATEITASALGNPITPASGSGSALPFTGGNSTELIAIAGGAVVVGETMRRLRNVESDRTDKPEPEQDDPAD